MITIAMMLASGQVPLSAEIDDMRWRSFVRASVSVRTPFAGRLEELERTVRRLPRTRPLRPAMGMGMGMGGPSGL